MLTMPLLLAAASAGALGGVHCAGMCGALAHMLGQASSKARMAASGLPGATLAYRVIPLHVVAPLQTLPTAWLDRIYLHGGRLFLYALLGALVGGVGAGGLWLGGRLQLGALQKVLFIAGNLALIFLGLRLLQWRVPLPMWLRRLRTSLASSRILPGLQAASGKLLAHGGRHPFLSGMAWGCLPCGLLYAVLPFALLSGAASSGAILMLVFGVASLPHLLLASSSRALSQRWRPVAALLLLALGGFGLLHTDMQQMPAWLCVTAG